MTILNARGVPYRPKDPNRKPHLETKSVKPTLVNIRDLPPEAQMPSMRHWDLFMPGHEDILSKDGLHPGNINPNVPWKQLHQEFGPHFWGPWYGYCEMHAPNQGDDYLVYDKFTSVFDGLRREWVHMYSDTQKRGFRSMKIYQYEGCVPYKELSEEYADMERLVLHRT